MKKASQDKKEEAPVAPPRASVGKKASAPLAESPPDQNVPSRRCPFKNMRLPKAAKMKDNCGKYCAVASYGVLGTLTILISFVTLAVSGVAAVAMKAYDTEQSTRLVANVLLSVTAAVSLSMIIYSISGLCKKNTKPMYATGIVLVILSVIQALITGVAVNVTESDELQMGKTITNSFRLAKEGNARHLKLWGATQYELRCCGLYGPEDYRDAAMPYYFPPNIPITCCPMYNSSKPTHAQERQRELCKSKSQFYDIGCKGLVVETFRNTSYVVIGVVVSQIVLQLAVTALGSYIYRSKKKENATNDVENIEVKETSSKTKK